MLVYILPAMTETMKMTAVDCPRTVVAHIPACRIVFRGVVRHKLLMLGGHRRWWHRVTISFDWAPDVFVWPSHRRCAFLPLFNTSSNDSLVFWTPVFVDLPFAPSICSPSVEAVGFARQDFGRSTQLEEEVVAVHSSSKQAGQKGKTVSCLWVWWLSRILK